MYNLTIFTISGRIYSFDKISLAVARNLVDGMGKQLDSANICKYNNPLMRIKG